MWPAWAGCQPDRMLWRVLAMALLAAAATLLAFQWRCTSGCQSNSGSLRRQLPARDHIPHAPLANLTDLYINAPVGTDGRLTGPTLDRIVVFARSGEDPEFLKDMQDIPYLVYQDNNDTAFLSPPHGGGMESRAYLKFIVDNFDRLPDRMVFAHFHRFSWHHILDATGRYRLLRWKDAPSFANMRGTDINMWQSHLWPNHLELSWDEDAKKSAMAFKMSMCRHWVHTHSPQALWQASAALHLNGTAGTDPPNCISAPCCGEFTVTSQRVRSRPLKLYEDLLEFATRKLDIDNFYVGRSFEYIWHIVFGEPVITGAVHECALYNCDGYRKLPRVAHKGACELGKSAGCNG